MAFNKSFLEDEVRLGFYVPAAIKQAWAAELEILEAINDICSKHSINYFADWGSFLGAVRHRGFIPWDDDMDLVMLREDYNKFLEIAPSELPQGYSIHTFRNEDGFVEFHAVVINTEHARFDKEHFDRFHGFPYTCGVDIFVLDFVHPDEETEMKRAHDITYIIAFADGMLSKKFNSETLNAGFSKIESMCNFRFDRSKSDKELWIDLYDLAEKLCASVSKNESDTITQMIPWGLKHQINRRYSYKEYTDSIKVAFEYSSIPLPIHFNKLLIKRYGEYMKLIKNAGAHDYPYFDKQKHELEELLGHKLFEYNPLSITPHTNDSNHENWRNIVNECIENLRALTDNICSMPLDVINQICDAQNMAIDLGNYIESIKGENQTAITPIEDYCEILFELHEAIINAETPSKNEFESSGLSASFDIMKNSIEETLITRKEVVFLPFKADFWNSMSSLYEFYKSQKDYDVYVMPIPYYYKEYDGTLTDEQYDLNSYKDELDVVSYKDFPLDLRHPDVIVIQYPYDSYNASTGIPPIFYSDRLKQCTDKLIYVPWFRTYDFTIKNEREYKNMDYYVPMPGVLNSDIVYVQSEALRETYIQKLTDWYGQNGEWTNKISVFFDYDEVNTITKTAKTVLYYIGVAQPLENEFNFIDKISRSLDIFKRSCTQINLVFYPDPSLLNNISKYSPHLLQPFLKILEKFKIDDFGEYFNEQFDEVLLQRCDAFYGDAGYIATLFADRKKPVMIQNYNL